MPILKVSFALLVILANKKLDLIIFDDKVLPIDLLLPKLEDFLKNVSQFLFISDQMKISKHILQHVEVVY